MPAVLTLLFIVEAVGSQGIIDDPEQRREAPIVESPAGQTRTDKRRRNLTDHPDRVREADYSDRRTGERDGTQRSAASGNGGGQEENGVRGTKRDRRGARTPSSFELIKRSATVAFGEMVRRALAVFSITNRRTDDEIKARDLTLVEKKKKKKRPRIPSQIWVRPAPPSEPPSSVPSSPLPSAAPSASPAPPGQPVTFFAVGDTPYSDAERCLLPLELAKLTNEVSGYDSAFLIHLGDIRDGKPLTGTDPPCAVATPCPESLFQDVSRTFENAPMTTFFIPGDNGWLDCFDADDAYGYWKRYLFRFNDRSDLGWPTFPATVSRDTDRPELFSFLLRKILFLGQGLPGSGRDPENAWTPRDDMLADNAKWTEYNFDRYGADMKAAVIFGHSSAPTGCSRFCTNENYFVELERIALKYSSIPILFLEDAHSFQTEEEYRDAPNVFRIAQDDTVTPMAVTVHPDAVGLRNVFRYDRRCYCSTSHRPTRFLNPTSQDCDGQCDTTAHRQCQNMERCSPEGSTWNGDVCTNVC